jgi:hypothetical protein
VEVARRRKASDGTLVLIDGSPLAGLEFEARQDEAGH